MDPSLIRPEPYLLYSRNSGIDLMEDLMKELMIWIRSHPEITSRRRHMIYSINMKNAALAVLLIPLIALAAPVLAESPSEIIRADNDASNVSSNTSGNMSGNISTIIPTNVSGSISSNVSIKRTIINPMDPGYVWGNPNAIDLSGADPSIFEKSAFNKVAGGIMSEMYTASINRFRNADQKAGFSNATRKAAKVGLVNWPKA
jgi:hypothetical protein